MSLLFISSFADLELVMMEPLFDPWIAWLRVGLLVFDKASPLEFAEYMNL